ncbi:hypothetical protein EVAR_59816_1 [Eumeta japonica]|uniref:Uncharacterized protein n=1 Tax=Eumeta variegata TaxID=151549 RepID=A0A4C1ZCH9_EUMVA|nr:hypothetical protein EVAR_59816_1 [Eumeta japonica]
MSYNSESRAMDLPKWNRAVFVALRASPPRFNTSSDTISGYDLLLLRRVFGGILRYQAALKPGNNVVLPIVVLSKVEALPEAAMFKAESNSRSIRDCNCDQSRNRKEEGESGMGEGRETHRT